jgi:hypothetical protein
VEVPPLGPRDTHLSADVGTKFRQQVAVAQSVYFACGLRAMEFVFFIVLASGMCTESVADFVLLNTEELQITN